MSCASKSPQVGAPSGWNGLKRSSCRGTRLTRANFGDKLEGTRHKFALEVMGALLRLEMRLRQGPTGFDSRTGGGRGRRLGGGSSARRAAWRMLPKARGDSELGARQGR